MKKTLLIFLLTPCFLVAQTISEKYIKIYIYILCPTTPCKAEKQVQMELKKQQKYIESEFKRIGLKSFLIVSLLDKSFGL